MKFRLKDFLSRYRMAAHRNPLGNPFLFEGVSAVTLHFNMDAIQGLMIKNDPEFLALGYTKTMMGFLFFQPSPKSIAMIGLGGGAIAKYCLRYLNDTHFTAIEINPKVIALRNQFNIPPDNGRFKVICANGADYVQGTKEKVDVLLIDGFKLNGQPESLSSAEFYNDCYAKLNDGGVMAVNLLKDNDYCTYTSRIRRSFKNKVWLVDAETPGNKIAFACKGDNFPPTFARIHELACTLEPKHRLPLQNIAQKLKLSIKGTAKQP